MTTRIWSISSLFRENIQRALPENRTSIINIAIIERQNIQQEEPASITASYPTIKTSKISHCIKRDKQPAWLELPARITSIAIQHRQDTNLGLRARPASIISIATQQSLHRHPS
jgi:hypothetical protein